MSRRLGRPMRRSARLQHLQSRGTLERCDAPNDKTTRRRCWSRHLGLRHCHRSMRHLPRGSPCQATSRGRSSTWTTPNFRGCWRQLPSRSIAAIKGTPKNETATAAATRMSSLGQSAAFRNKTRGIDEFPEGTANLIRASFRAGVKPAAIARTFRISQSFVNRILSATEKPGR